MCLKSQNAQTTPSARPAGPHKRSAFVRTRKTTSDNAPFQMQTVLRSLTPEANRWQWPRMTTMEWTLPAGPRTSTFDGIYCSGVGPVPNPTNTKTASNPPRKSLLVPIYTNNVLWDWSAIVSRICLLSFLSCRLGSSARLFTNDRYWVLWFMAVFPPQFLCHELQIASHTLVWRNGFPKY